MGNHCLMGGFSLRLRLHVTAGFGGPRFCGGDKGHETAGGFERGEEVIDERQRSRNVALSPLP
jgi:hypothetical protein